MASEHNLLGENMASPPAATANSTTSTTSHVSDGDSAATDGGVVLDQSSYAPMETAATSVDSAIEIKQDTSSTKAGATDLKAPWAKDPDYQPDPTVEPHPDTVEIVRQVEFYFSDENLPQDAHLLSKTGEFGDGWVQLKSILGFPKMRKIKPQARVKRSLHESGKLLIWKNKMIRRIEPLTIPLLVEPKENSQREKVQELVDKPWIPAGMLKPTGLEDNFVEPVMTPQQAEQEKKLYDPEEAFYMRIDIAVARYQTKRKMHQNNRLIFSSFLTYGGFKSGPNVFTGGWSNKDMEDMTKDEIAELKSQFAVDDQVIEGLDPQEGSPTWVVDFVTHAKAYLSCDFMSSILSWRDQEDVHAACNLMRNFYNYLTYHEVCPEYTQQILEARSFCDDAEKEFPRLAQFDKGLKGGFNAACSIVHNGYHKEAQPQDINAEWVSPDDLDYMKDDEAHAVFLDGIHAHGDEDEFNEIRNAIKNKTIVRSGEFEQMGLEIIAIELPSDDNKAVYDSPTRYRTPSAPTGKLICVRWQVPSASPQDLPAHVLNEQSEKLEFIMEEQTLRACVPGMKFEANVGQSETGLRWIDSFSYVYPSFYTYTLNEPMQGYKKPGEAKAWMKRKWAQPSDSRELVKAEDADAEGDGVAVEDDDEDYDDDGLD